MSFQSVLDKFLMALRNRGLVHIGRSLIRHLVLLAPRLLGLLLFRTILRKRTFRLAGKEYAYSIDTYNWTWANERTVEVPYFWELVKENSGKNILEVGNVLSHYYTINHEVLDKYEQGPGVINADVVNFDPQKRYDLIISISTLEHVGWHDYDPDEYQPGKCLAVIRHLQDLLEDDGRLIFSFPKGYNAELESYFEKRLIAPKEAYVLRRPLWINTWHECSWEEVLDRNYKLFWRIPLGLVIVQL